MSVPRSLGQFIAEYEELRPEDVVRIAKPIDSKFEITAIAKHFEEQNKFPLFENVIIKSLKQRDRKSRSDLPPRDYSGESSWSPKLRQEDGVARSCLQGGRGQMQIASLDKF